MRTTADTVQALERLCGAVREYMEEHARSVEDTRKRLDHAIRKSADGERLHTVLNLEETCDLDTVLADLQDLMTDFNVDPQDGLEGTP